jgi:hypothetical protein
MAKFLTPLKALEYIDGRKWKVLSDVEFLSDVLQGVVVVKAGRITDFASIPRGLWNLYPPTKYAAPATVHDELYTEQTCSRQEADEVFLEALKVDGVPYLRRYAFYWALRAAGWAAWNSHKRANAKEAQNITVAK